MRLSTKWLLVVLIDFGYVTADKSTGYEIFDQLLKYLSIDSGECWSRTTFQLISYPAEGTRSVCMQTQRSWDFLLSASMARTMKRVVVM